MPESAGAVHSLIVGAGPAGLAAAYELTNGGVSPIVVEKESVSGGLMRSIKRGDFVVDIGRKELYTRFPEVDALWSHILGHDLRPYPHRFGVLYRGRILEVSSSYRGLRRGMPLGMFLVSGLDMLWWLIRPYASPPQNYQDFWYRNCGRRFSRIFAQGFWEKFHGVTWIQMPLPPDVIGRGTPSIARRLRQGLSLGHVKAPEGRNWRHPAKGTGQICDALERIISNRGGQLIFDAEVIEMCSSNGRITTVTVQSGRRSLRFTPQHVVSSLPIQRLEGLLREPPRVGRKTTSPDGFTSSTVLVYLFLHEEPRFPHAWLEVATPDMKAGRITNYARFNGEMVPAGRTCLCVEFFCFGRDPLFDLDDEEIRRLAMDECTRSSLIDPDACFDSLVLRLPGADAATDWRDWEIDGTRHLAARLARFRNLYDVNRPGTDRATQAGLFAAKAILSGDRARFDAGTDASLERDLDFGVGLIAARL